MLLLGTDDHLEDLDRQYTIAENVSVTAIATSPSATDGASMSSRTSSGTEVCALLDAQRIVRVEEFGLAPVLRLDRAEAQCMAATAEGPGRAMLVGLHGARLGLVAAASTTMEPLTAFDAVPGRDGWQNPAGPTPDLRSIAVSPAGTWFVNVHVGGVWRSTDRGETWSNVVEPEADVHEVAAGPDGRLVVAAAEGFGWSVDDGETWSWTTEGLHASYCRAVALDGDVAFVSASTGPSTRDGRLYRTTLGGTLSPCAGGLPASFPFNLDTGCVAARAGQVAVGTGDGRVWRSWDRGQTFEPVTERVGRVQVLRFA